MSRTRSQVRANVCARDVRSSWMQCTNRCRDERLSCATCAPLRSDGQFVETSRPVNRSRNQLNLRVITLPRRSGAFADRPLPVDGLTVAVGKWVTRGEGDSWRSEWF